MVTTHRTLRGGWRACGNPAGCPLRFHFPDMTPEQMAAIPLVTLLPLFEAVDPPQMDVEEGKFWFNESKLSHRAYDLPAVIGYDGWLEWSLNGLTHREGGRVAMLDEEGMQVWYRHGRLHRTDGPAVLAPGNLPLRNIGWSNHDGSEYWTNGSYALYGLLFTETEWAGLRDANMATVREAYAATYDDRVEAIANKIRLNL